MKFWKKPMRPDPGFIELVESYSPGRNDQILNQYILILYQKARSHVQPRRWLEEARENLRVETLEELENSALVKMVWKDAGRVFGKWPLFYYQRSHRNRIRGRRTVFLPEMSERR